MPAELLRLRPCPITRAVSLILAVGIVCFLSLFALAAFGVLLVVRSERRREAAEPRRTPPRAVHSTADMTVYLRFEGRGALAMETLVDQHAPYGVLPVDALRPTAEAVLAVLDDATHGVLVVAGHRVVPVRIPVPAGLVVCLRARSRAPLAVPIRPAHRHDLATLLRELSTLDPAQVISADFLRAKATSDGAAPELELLLGPHLPPESLTKER